MPSQIIKSAVIPVLILMSFGLGLGCAAPTGESVESRPMIDPSAAPDTTRDPNIFSAAIYTPYDVIYIDNFELEFNQRRGIRAMIGFDEEDFSTLKNVPWSQLTRVDFEETVDPSIWEQIYSGREDQGLRRDQTFKILLHQKSGTTRYFYAMVSKFRGYKDGVKWTLGMTGNPIGIEYIEFNP